MISTNLRIVAIAGSVALLVFVVELVRRRRLKEEYSVLWVATALALLLLATWGGLLHDLAHFIGANSQASTLYFFGILFIVSLLLHFSVRVSNLERRVVVLLQEIALQSERREERGSGTGGDPDRAPEGPNGRVAPRAETRAGENVAADRVAADRAREPRVQERAAQAHRTGSPAARMGAGQARSASDERTWEASLR
jgi:hypothetical protein